jgi:hypothetical protein
VVDGGKTRTNPKISSGCAGGGKKVEAGEPEFLSTKYNIKQPLFGSSTTLLAALRHS